MCSPGNISYCQFMLLSDWFIVGGGVIKAIVRCLYYMYCKPCIGCICYPNSSDVTKLTRDAYHIISKYKVVQSGVCLVYHRTLFHTFNYFLMWYLREESSSILPRAGHLRVDHPVQATPELGSKWVVSWCPRPDHHNRLWQ